MVHFLGCGRASIYTWLKMGREAPEMLAARPHLGPEPGLDDARLAELERLLLQGAKAARLPETRWTGYGELVAVK